MNGSQIWKILGIDKTPDKREIKRAYATKLKAIDPDKDPKGFLELRAALDSALRHADFSQPPQDFGPVGEDVDDAPHWDREDQIPQDTEAGPLDKDGQRRYRLSEILWADDPIRPLEEEAQQLAVQIIDATDLGTIEEHAQTEEWLLWLTANTIRRSDCIIPLLEHHYKWRDKVGTLQASRAHEAVGGRYNDLVFFAAIQHPEHAHNVAFDQLVLPREYPPSYLLRAALTPKIRTLLAKIRYDHPTAEWELDPNSVELWEQAIGLILPAHLNDEPAGFTWYFWLLLTMFVVTIIAVAVG
jgi:hypothetical protein